MRQLCGLLEKPAARDLLVLAGIAVTASCSLADPKDNGEQEAFSSVSRVKLLSSVATPM